MAWSGGTLRLTQQPLVQMLPPQHGAPGVSHTWQIELLHIVLASLHLELGQHGPPADPHSLHVLVLLSQAASASSQPVGLAVVAGHGWTNSTPAPTTSQVVSRAPNGLRDRVKLRSCERPKARGGRILDVFDRRATQGRDANARFHDGSQPVRCSRTSALALQCPV
jgi:hypothetical protein